MEWTKIKERFNSVKSIVHGCWPPPRMNPSYEFDQSTSICPEADVLPDPVVEKCRPESRPASRCLSTGFSLIGYTFLLQLGLHLMTFLLNGLAYRRLDTTSLGLVNVRIGLFYSTLMFISREAFRRACLSRGGELVTQTATDPRRSQASGAAGNLPVSPRLTPIAGLIDLTWSILPLSALLGSMLLAVWIWILPCPSQLITTSGEVTLPVKLIDRQYVICLLVYALSGLFELSTESFWLVCQLSHRVRARILIEAFANAARAVGVVAGILYAPPDYAVYALGLPQILHGTTLLVSYLFYFYFVLKRPVAGDSNEPNVVERFTDLFPRVRQFSPDRPALKLAQNLFGQGVLKQLLTEGERYLISAFHLISFTEQGIYDLVNNLGSLAARLLFMPMEESCHFVFNQCLAREAGPERQDPRLLQDVMRMFRTVLRTCTLVGWIGVTFAQANSCLLLLLYAGPSLAENHTAVTLLRLYAVYVLLLAWNGSTEAFLNAAMSTEEVARHNKRLVLFSVMFLAANGLLVPWVGVHGFVLANCINMLSRIAYSCSFIHQFVKHHKMDPSTTTKESSYKEVPATFLPRLMLPSLKEFLALAASLAITLVSERYFCCSFGWTWLIVHALITASTVSLVLLLFLLEEQDLTEMLRSGMWKRKVD